MDYFDWLFLTLELTGTIAFAISGAMLAIEKKLDLFGAVVLGTVCAVGGGLLRDLILGNTPPAMFQNPIYAFSAIITCIITFSLEYAINKHCKFSEKIKKNWYDTKFMNLCDSIGLGIFVIVGMNAAINSGYFENAFLCIFIAVITGIGGGMIGETLVAAIPKVLRKRIYAVAGIIAAIVYYIFEKISLYKPIGIFIVIALTVAIRFLAIHYNWNLPYIDKTEEGNKIK